MYFRRQLQQPFSEEQAQAALATISKTGTFAVALGAMSTVITLALAVLLRMPHKNMDLMSIATSLLPSLLIFGSGLTIRRVTLQNIHAVERLLEVTAFAILGFLMVALLDKRGVPYSYPLLPLLLVGSMTRAITLAKKLQIST